MEKVLFEIAGTGLTGLISRTTAVEKTLAFRPPELVSRSLSQKNYLLCRDASTGKILGWIEKFHITDNVWGVSTLYVFPGFRGRGIGTQLIRRITASLSGRTIFTAASGRMVVRTMSEIGFTKISFPDIPGPVKFWWLIRRYYHPATWKKYLSGDINDLTYLVRKVN